MANFFSDTYDKFKDLDPLGDSLGWHPEDPNDKPGAKPSSPDPYGSAGQAVQWDASGRPIGRMPMGKTALDWQYEADRRTELRKQALWGDAQNVMRQGTDLLKRTGLADRPHWLLASTRTVARCTATRR